MGVVRERVVLHNVLEEGSNGARIASDAPQRNSFYRAVYVHIVAKEAHEGTLLVGGGELDVRDSERGGREGMRMGMDGNDGSARCGDG